MVNWDGKDYGDVDTEEVRDGFSFYTGGYYNETTEWGYLQFDEWMARYRESVIDEVEDHLVRRDQFTERTLTVIDELRGKK